MSVRCLMGDFPMLTTTSASSITSTSFVCGGSISYNGNYPITSCGVCWSTIQNPTINDSKTSDSNSSGTFTSNITGLNTQTTYYVRAYATNTYGTAYGTQLTVSTALPTITTTAISSITTSAATSGGTVGLPIGAATVTTRGICWSINQNPTITDNHTSDGTDIGVFISSITGLTAGTTYYVRAYATNSAGTAYGSQLNFTTTLNSVTDIDGNVYKVVMIGNQVWMAENLKTTHYQDGIAIPVVTDNTVWSNLTYGACCNYNNDATNGIKYGKLYNWYAVNTTKLAPVGWHVATDAEWTTLQNYVSANVGISLSVAKALATTTDWYSSTNSGAVGNNLTINNSTGFTALPSGNRYNFGGFDALVVNCMWWSSTSSSATNAWYRYLGYDNGNLSKSTTVITYGYSVRCVKD